VAGPIYKLYIYRFKEAEYQLSEKEREDIRAQLAASLQEVGGKEVIRCNSVWSSEEWLGFGVEEFPDIEAVQKHAQNLLKINRFRHIESRTLLGTKLEPS
jgi:hypothetical protein